MGFKKPEKVIQGTKILIYGEAGTRKSRTALTFPRIAYIDADMGADSYYEEFADNLASISDSTTFAEVSEDLENLRDMLDEFDTVVLDSDTKIYENQQHAAMKVVEQRARKNKRLVEGEGLSTKEWGIIKLNHEKMYSNLFELKKEGKIIIVITEAKDEKEAIQDMNGGVSYKTVGIIPNTTKGSEYDFDIVLEMVKDKNDKFVGAKVIKDRLGVVPEGEVIEDPSYEIWAEAIERKRKGTKKAERKDFEASINKEVESFDVTGSSKVAKLHAQIKEATGTMESATKRALAKQFKEILGDSDFTKSNDLDGLQKCLELVNEAKK